MMMMVPRVIVVVLATLFLTSCLFFTTFYVEPTAEEETLVIGSVLFRCENTQPGSVPIGEYTYNVEVAFEDDTGRVYEDSSGHKGLFYVHNPRGHRLRLVGLSYEQIGAQTEGYSKEQLERSMEMTATAEYLPTTPPVFEIQRNVVNNLGLILWQADMNADIHEIEMNWEYVETRAALVEHFPNSLWIQRKWVEIRSD